MIYTQTVFKNHSGLNDLVFAFDNLDPPLLKFYLLVQLINLLLLEKVMT